jgi:hypothetical protein
MLGSFQKSYKNSKIIQNLYQNLQPHTAVHKSALSPWSTELHGLSVGQRLQPGASKGIIHSWKQQVQITLKPGKKGNWMQLTAWSGRRKFMFKIQINNDCKKQNTADQRVYVILTSLSGLYLWESTFQERCTNTQDSCRWVDRFVLSQGNSGGCFVAAFQLLGAGLDLRPEFRETCRSGSASKLDAPKTMRRRYSVYIYIIYIYYYI